MKNPVLDSIHDIGVVPVIAIDDAEKGKPLAEALASGGLPVAEITFRTAAGQEAIKNIAKHCPNIVLGAGTVLNVEQVKMAVDSGASFIVSPGYNQDIVDYCQKRGIAVLPGCSNASDMTRAVNAGLEAVKFFPAEQSGGLNTIKALAPVFPSLKVMPTGGINAKNLKEYLSNDRVFGCGGTWMVKKEDINKENWESITDACKKTVDIILDITLKHVGINCEEEKESRCVADAICTLLGLEYKEGNSSIFAGGSFEVMKRPGNGKNGHIAIGVNNIKRALYHFGAKGAAFNFASQKNDNDGNIMAIYFKDEIGGFALHLVKNS